jgi:RNA polymerase-binding transcription factor DksA
VVATSDRLSPEQLERLKRILLNKGRDLAEKLSQMMAGKTVTIEDILSPKPGETPIERLRRYLDLVDGRIKAINAGTYGNCFLCNAPLSYVELEQMPWAQYCQVCAAKDTSTR